MRLMCAVMHRLSAATTSIFKILEIPSVLILLKFVLFEGPLPRARYEITTLVVRHFADQIAV
jgi:hypothetical protein